VHRAIAPIEPALVLLAAGTLALRCLPHPAAPPPAAVARAIPPAAHPAEDPAIARLRDARTIYDLAHLAPADLAPGWRVAAITPGARSGAGTIPGAYIEAETGRFVNPDSAAMVMIVEGSWQIVTGPERGTGTYSWQEPLAEFHTRLPEPDDLFSPFVHGGLIVVQPGWSASERFGHPPLVWPSWIADLDARVQVIARFRAALAAEDRDAIAAQLAAADDRMMAVMAYLVLTDRHGDGMADLLRPVTWEGVRWLALAREAADTFR